MEAGAEVPCAGWERKDGQAERSRQGEEGVQEKWRRSRMDRRGRRGLVRGQTTRKNIDRQGTDFSAGGEGWEG